MVFVHKDVNLVDACRRMRECGTGELTVIAEANGCPQPLGTLSAHDIAMRVIALELDPSVLTAGDLSALTRT